jgi:hypothetical protein
MHTEALEPTCHVFPAKSVSVLANMFFCAPVIKYPTFFSHDTANTKEEQKSSKERREVSRRNRGSSFPAAAELKLTVLICSYDLFTLLYSNFEIIMHMVVNKSH